MANVFNKFIGLGLIGVSMTPFALAQTLEGRITDASGEAPLQGAIVTIEGADRTTTTDRTGRYRINNLSSGSYNVIVSYIGTEPVRASVEVPASGAVLNLTLGENVRLLDNVLVVGSAAAQAGAINQQRASDAIISVIDSDGLGNFPDTTVADSLSRVPGLSIENDQGEGRYVSIRGINTDLISASINGVRTPSPEDRRGVLLDGVPSDLLDTIEVQKSLTPNVDGDSLGGVINLKTISAFDRKGRFVRVKAEGRWNEITEEFSPKATLTYSNTFSDTFGAAFSINYQDLRIESHNHETGGWGLDAGSNLFYPNDDFEQRWYGLNRKRLGFVANFDWRPSENTDLYLRTLFNQYEDDEIRNKFEFREFDEEVIAISPTSVSIRRGEVDAEVRQRLETRQIQTYALGGETRLDVWTFDYQISYAFAEEDDTDNHDVAFRSTPEQRNSVTGSITYDYTNPRLPVISGPALAFLQNPANYELDAYEREFTVNDDTEWAAQFNVARDAVFAGAPVEWRGGLKLRDREKNRDNDFTFHEPDLNMAAFVKQVAPIGNWRLSNDMYFWPDADLTAALRNQLNPADFDEEASFFESQIADYTIEEQVLAGYAMGTFDRGPLTIVVGVRIEQTNADLAGNIAEEGSPVVTRRTVSQDYTNVLPSVNLRYDFSDRLIGRAAYYAALVRPGFGEMAPSTVLNEDRDGIELGNPNLDPYEADNFDLAIEYYPTKLSVISFGVFHKSIDNAIFPATFDIADVPASVDLSFLPAATLATLEEVSTFINVGKSSITGVEINYVQQLDFLAAPFDGFLVSANLTLTDSKSELPDGREVPFLKQSDTVWNVAVGYDKGPWDLRISANFRDDYLDELFETDLDRYTDDRMLVEASAKYNVNDTLQIYVEGKNLTDEEEYYYHGREDRLSQYDEFGRSVIAGIRLTF
jgi:TonB-dependent receptor